MVWVMVLTGLLAVVLMIWWFYMIMRWVLSDVPQNPRARDSAERGDD